MMPTKTTYQIVWMASFLILATCQSHPIVYTPSGPIKGVIVPTLGQDIVQFRNIPYAKPPVGNLRFEKPVPIEPWTETLDGTVFGPSCIQDTVSLPQVWEKAENNITTEDCLQLNVFVPEKVSKTDKKAVMFWIHGGGFQIGNSWFLDPSFLVQKDVIVVTINYRLGVFGFLSTGDSALPGNYGLWDMIEALKWVNKNIASFGGDPESVTVFGESAGAYAISYLSVIPSNKGLFQRIIPQSGTAVAKFWSINDPFRIAKRVGSHVGCVTENDSIVNKEDLVACLKEKSSDDLFKAQSDPSTFNFGELSIEPPLWPIVDGELLFRNPYQSLEETKSEESLFFRSLDLMTGTTDNEGTIFPYIAMQLQASRNFNVSDGIPRAVFCDDIAPVFAREAFGDESVVPEMLCTLYGDDNVEEQARNACNLYADAAFNAPVVQYLDFHSKGKTISNSYQYLFTKEISFFFLLPSFSWARGAGHGVELLYLFGPGSMNQFDDSLSSPEGRAITEILTTYWTNFAKTGNPNGEGIVGWKTYTPSGRYFMNLNLKPFLDKDIFPDRMKLLTEDIPNKLKHGAKTEL